jgi:NADPH-dependent 2,4-dienoyl-CoA reductase/sulfur reductase-like enzyme
MTPQELEKARKALIKGCKACHPGRTEVLVSAAKVLAILGRDIVEDNNLFKFVMNTEETPPSKNLSSTDTIRRGLLTNEVGLAAVNPHILWPLLEANPIFIPPPVSKMRAGRAIVTVDPTDPKPELKPGMSDFDPDDEYGPGVIADGSDEANLS